MRFICQTVVFFWLPTFEINILSCLLFLTVVNIHFFFPSFSGLKQSEAESCYINIARTLEFYGVELHSGRVCLHCDFLLGGKKKKGYVFYMNLIAAEKTTSI